jgi:hypothetical protein
MRLMPWQELWHGPAPAHKTVSLSYDSMIAIQAMFASTKNRHWLVSCVTLTGLALRVITAFSSSLLFFQDGTIIVTQNVPVTLKDSFIIDIPRFSPQKVTSEPWDTLVGMLDYSRTLPPGYHRKLAYQTFSDFRTGPNASTSVTVNSIWSETECEAPMISVANNQTISSIGLAYLNLTAQTKFCADPANIAIRVTKRSNQTTTTYYPHIIDLYFGHGEGTNCRAADGPVFALGSAVFRGAVETKSDFVNSSIIFCKQSYHMGPVLVSTVNNSPPRIQRLDSAPSTPLKGELGWAVRALISRTEFPTFQSKMGTMEYNPNGNSNDDQISRPLTSVPTEVAYGYKLLGKTPPKTWADIASTEEMGRAIQEFYQNFAPLAAHFYLRQPAFNNETHTLGKFSESVGRLQVTSNIPHVMSSILGLLSLLSILTGIFFVPSGSFVPIYPWNLFGLMRILNNSPQFRAVFVNTAPLKFKIKGQYQSNIKSGGNPHPSPGVKMRGYNISGTGRLDRKKTDRRYVEGGISSWFEPTILQRWALVAMLMVLIGTISTLIVLLRLSESSEGLGEVQDASQYLHYLWTTLPTAVMLGIGMYFASLDNQVRVLAPFLVLQRGGSIKTLKFDYADRVVASAFFAALRRRVWPVVISTSTTVLVAFLTIFSSTLFSITPVPSRHPINIQQEEWFASFGWKTSNPEIMAVLVNDDAIRYPSWTYRDLVFPKLRALSTDVLPSSNMTLSVRVPALRPELTCTKHTMSDIQTAYNQKALNASDYENFVTMNITSNSAYKNNWDPTCGPLWKGFCVRNPKDRIRITCAAQTTHGFFNKTFGLFRETGFSTTECSTVQFVWGYLSNITYTWDFLAAYSCMSHITEVQVDLTLQWPSLEIDRTNPPKPIEESARRSSRFLSIGDLITLTPSIELSALSYKFVDLALPRYKLPYGYLGRADKEEVVLNAQKSHFTLMMTQLLSNTLRRGYNETAFSTFIDLEQNKLQNTTLSGRPFDGPFEATPSPPIPAELIDNTVLRVLQNSIPTYFLVGLLAVVLIINIANLWLIPRRVVPQNPSSIEGAVSLLADSNAYGYLPKEVEWMGEKDVANLFVSWQFSLGWFSNTIGEAVFTVQGIIRERSETVSGAGSRSQAKRS